MVQRAMKAASWTVEHLVEAGALDRRVADLVGRLICSVNSDDASRLAVLIEQDVAPQGAGLVHGAPGVAVAVVAGLPMMDRSARWCGVELLNQVAGWLLASDAGVDHDLVRVLMAALPGVAALAQIGDDDLRSAFVDFAALCAALDPSVVGQVAFYLQRVVEEVGGAVGASAQLELEQLAL